MSTVNDDIETLNVRLFDPIPSQTSDADKRSLLAVHRAIRKAHRPYSYLEIGSHLGGSLQSHFVDDRCEVIYSIDPRPLQQPDDRSQGFVATYTDNSTGRMIDGLKRLGDGDTSKLRCFELDASEVDVKSIDTPPALAFIDGEHTATAVVSDFEFCRKVVRRDGVILFHDFKFVYRGIEHICKTLTEQRVTHIPLMLEGSVFGIFFDSKLIEEDPYLSALFKTNRNFLRNFLLKRKIERALPTVVLKPLRSGYNHLKERRSQPAVVK